MSDPTAVGGSRAPAESPRDRFSEGVCAALTVLVSRGEDVPAKEIALANDPGALLRACDRSDELTRNFLLRMVSRVR